jgi:hypothetical protein
MPPPPRPLGPLSQVSRRRHAGCRRTRRNTVPGHCRLSTVACRPSPVEWQTTQARVHKRPHRSAWLELLPPVSLVACCCACAPMASLSAVRWPCSLGVVACRARLERESTSAIPPAPLHTRVHSSHSATCLSLASSFARPALHATMNATTAVNTHLACYGLPRPAARCRYRPTC